MPTKETLNPGLIDKRVVERNIKKGLVSRDSYEKYLGALADVADQAETVKAKLGAEEPEETDEALEEDEGAEESSDDEG
jgi:hypothetical protein